MTPIPLPALAIASVVLFAVDDRWWGSDDGFAGRKAIILLLAVGGSAAICSQGHDLHGALVGAIFGAIWFAARSMDFGTGALAPTNAGEMLNAAIHHLPVLPAAYIAAMLLKLNTLLTGVAFGVYVLLALALAFWAGYRKLAHEAAREPGGSENTLVELGRGALYGAALAVTALPILT